MHEARDRLGGVNHTGAKLVSQMEGVFDREGASVEPLRQGMGALFVGDYIFHEEAGDGFNDVESAGAHDIGMGPDEHPGPCFADESLKELELLSETALEGFYGTFTAVVVFHDIDDAHSTGTFTAPDFDDFEAVIQAIPHVPGLFHVHHVVFDKIGGLGDWSAIAGFFLVSHHRIPQFGPGMEQGAFTCRVTGFHRR